MTRPPVPGSSETAVTPHDEMHDIIARLDAFLHQAAPRAAEAAVAGAGPAAVEDEVWRPALARLAAVPAALHDPAVTREGLARGILRVASELVEASAAALYLTSLDGGLRLVAALPEDADEALDRQARGAVELALGEGKRRLERADPEPDRESSADAPSDACVLALPLVRDRSVPPGEDRRRLPRPREADRVGVLAFRLDAEPEPLILAALEALKSHALTALLRDSHLREAITDRATGALIRSQLNRELERRGRLFQQTRSPFCLLLLEVDRYRGILADFGRDALRPALRRLVTVLREELRGEDRLYRYGGPMFAVLLPDTDTEGGRVVAEKLRARAAAETFRKGRLSITLSLGLATCPLHAMAPSELQRKADQALARAKERGRNRCEVWSSERGAGAPGSDPLAGILTGDTAEDYEHVRVLLETFAELSRADELPALLASAVDRVLDALDAERGAIMLKTASGRLETRIGRSRERRDLELDERFSRSLPERVLRTGEPIALVVDPGPDEAPSESFAQLELRTVFCAPLVTGGKTLGVLYADGRALTGPRREAMLPFFTALAGYIALAVENARLRDALGEDRGESRS